MLVIRRSEARSVFGRISFWSTFLRRRSFFTGDHIRTYDYDLWSNRKQQYQSIKTRRFVRTATCTHEEKLRLLHASRNRKRHVKKRGGVATTWRRTGTGLVKPPQFRGGLGHGSRAPLSPLTTDWPGTLTCRPPPLFAFAPPLLLRPWPV